MAKKIAQKRNKKKHLTKKERKSIVSKQMLRQEIHRRLARVHPSFFITYTGVDDKGKSLSQYSIHEKIQKHLDGGDRQHVEIPRGHGKSVQGEYRICWEIGRDHNLFVKLLCQDKTQSMKRLGSIMKILESPRFNEVFPDFQPDYRAGWNKSMLYCNRDTISPNPTVEACGILGAGAGSRSHLILADDICDMKNTLINPAEKQKVIDTFFGTWSNLLLKDGRIWYFDTPYTEDDCSSVIRDNSRYNTLRMPILDFQPIWPEQFSEERLRLLLEELGEREYARAYELTSINEEDCIFKPKYILEHDIIQENFPAGLTGSIGVDPNASERNFTNGDYFATVTIGFNKTEVWILDCYMEKIGFANHEQAVHDVAAYATDKLVDRIHGINFEETGYQGKLKVDVADETFIPCYGIRSLRDKVSRAGKAANYWGNGKIKIWKGMRNFNEFMRLLTFFPLAKYDDPVDGLSLSIEGLPFYFGDTENQASFSGGTTADTSQLEDDLYELSLDIEKDLEMHNDVFEMTTLN